MKTKSFLARTALLLQNHPIIAALGIILGIVGIAVFLHLRQPLYASSGVIENSGSKGTNTFAFLSHTKSPISEKITSEEFLTAAIENSVKPITCYVNQDLHKRATTYGFPYEITYTANNKSFNCQEYTITETGEESFTLVSNIHGLQREKTAKFGEEIVDQNLTLIINKKKRTPYIAEPIFGTNEFSFKIQSPKNLAYELASGKVKANDQNGVLTVTCLHENAQ